MCSHTEWYFTMLCFTQLPLQRCHFCETLSLQDVPCSFWPFPTLMKLSVLYKLLFHSYAFNYLVSIFVINARINICVSVF